MLYPLHGPQTAPQPNPHPGANEKPARVMNHPSASARAAVRLHRLLRTRLPTAAALAADATALATRPSYARAMAGCPLALGPRAAHFHTLARSTLVKVPTRTALEASGMLGTLVAKRGMGITRGELLRGAKIAANMAPMDVAAQTHYVKLLNDSGQYQEVRPRVPCGPSGGCSIGFRPCPGGVAVFVPPPSPPPPSRLYSLVCDRIRAVGPRASAGVRGEGDVCRLLFSPSPRRVRRCCAAIRPAVSLLTLVLWHRLSALHQLWRPLPPPL